MGACAPATFRLALMEETPTKRTRGSAFDDAVLEAGFWFVLASARGIASTSQDSDTDLVKDLTPHVPSIAIARVAASHALAAKKAVESGQEWTISAQEFERTRAAILSGWNISSSKGAALWPPGGQTVATRLGGGQWNAALRAMGLAVSTQGRARGGSKFTREDVIGAVVRFLKEAKGRGLAPSFVNYTQWSSQKRDAGEDIPAPATVRQKLRSWSAATEIAHEHIEVPNVPRSGS